MEALYLHPENTVINNFSFSCENWFPLYRDGNLGLWSLSRDLYCPHRSAVTQDFGTCDLIQISNQFVAPYGKQGVLRIYSNHCNFQVDSMFDLCQKEKLTSESEVRTSRCL